MIFWGSAEFQTSTWINHNGCCESMGRRDCATALLNDNMRSSKSIKKFFLFILCFILNYVNVSLCVSAYSEGDCPKWLLNAVEKCAKSA